MKWTLSATAIALLTLGVGCSDLPSEQAAYDDLEHIDPVAIVTTKGDATGEIDLVYSKDFLMEWEVRRMANKTLVIQFAEASGMGSEATKRFLAYAEVRAQNDPDYREHLRAERDRIIESFRQAASDPTSTAYEHRNENMKYEYLATLLNRYGVTYEEMKKPIPDEFIIQGQEGAERRVEEFLADEAARKLEEASAIPAEFMIDDRKTPEEFLFTRRDNAEELEIEDRSHPEFELADQDEADADEDDLTAWQNELGWTEDGAQDADNSDENPVPDTDAPDAAAPDSADPAPVAAPFAESEKVDETEAHVAPAEYEIPPEFL
jgi:hypothetical protein